jgi:DNA-binding NarL/FixJ family response regulator
MTAEVAFEGDTQTAHAAIRAGIADHLRAHGMPVAADHIAAAITPDVIQALTNTGWAIIRQSTAPAATADTDDGPHVTPRRRAVLVLAAAGHSNRVISQRLHISDSTVKSHVAWLLQAFGVRSRHTLAAPAIALGVITLAEVEAAIEVSL